MANITAAKFQELLARAKAIAAAAKEEDEVASIATIEQLMEKEKPDYVDNTCHEATNINGPSTIYDDVISKSKSLDTDLEGSSVKLPRIYGVARDDIILNTKQQLIQDTILTGADCVLIGAAGTGKTTSMRSVTRKLIETNQVPKLLNNTKWLLSGVPGILICSYTRKAVNNIRHAVVDELKQHTLTLHKVLEFAPVFYEIQDPKDPTKFKKTMRFEPQRNRYNPLPKELQLIIFEESSMISVELYLMLQDALPHPHQEVFIGDIQQLPPIFGKAILGFKLSMLPVIELTEVYRQALQSPIIDLAWKILSGDPTGKIFSTKTVEKKVFSQVLKREVTRIEVPSLITLSRETEYGTVIFQPWQKKLSADMALNTFNKQVQQWIEVDYFNPDEDIILCPFNKAFGTIEINKSIANYLGRKRGAVVYEVIAGYNKHYLAEGDRVLFDKEDATIISINRNGEYLGKLYQAPSIHLDRHGHMSQSISEEERLALQAEDNIDFNAEEIDRMMELTVEAMNNEERVQAASHIVTLKLTYSDDEVTLSDAAEINNLLGGYALTVHKFQGSENEKIFFVMHESHRVMNQRELLYTAVTRAKNFLHIICEVGTFYKGVKSQKIKGNTIAEKSLKFINESAKMEEIQAISNQLKKEGDKHKLVRKVVETEDIHEYINGIEEISNYKELDNHTISTIVVPVETVAVVNPIEVARQKLAELRARKGR